MQSNASTLFKFSASTMWNSRISTSTGWPTRTAINQTMFNGLVQLKYLDLANNPIGENKNSPFIGLISLERLCLVNYGRWNQRMRRRNRRHLDLDPLVFSSLAALKDVGINGIGKRIFKFFSEIELGSYFSQSLIFIFSIFF